jgi:predicted nucleic acid-binding protein
MYLLNSQVVFDLFSRDENRPIFQWLSESVRDVRQLFVSVISLGQIAHAIEDLPPQDRNNWRRLVQEGRRVLKVRGSLIDIDMDFVDVWESSLRGNRLVDVADAEEQLGEDDRLIIATAIARNYVLVTPGSRLIEEIAERTTLAIQAL